MRIVDSRGCEHRCRDAIGVLEELGKLTGHWPEESHYPDSSRNDLVAELHRQGATAVEEALRKHNESAEDEAA